MSFFSLFASSCPPKYEDIGKQIKDLFNKNYNFGNVKLEVKSKSSVGSNLNIEAVSEIENGKVNGFAELKNVFSGSDMTIGNKWLTDNTIITEISLDNRFQSGTKFGISVNFDPKSGKLGGSVTAEIKSQIMFSKIDINCKEGKPEFMPSFVFNVNGWLAGTQFILDPQSKKIDKPCITAGYQADNFSAFSFLNEKNELYGSLYQKVNSDLEAGIMLQLPYGGNKQTQFEYAMAYDLDSNHRVQTKVNTQCQIGVSVAKNFGNGIQLNLSGNLDGKNLKQGAHKIGLGILLDM